MKYLPILSALLVAGACCAEAQTFRQGLYVQRPHPEGGPSYTFSEGRFVWRSSPLTNEPEVARQPADGKSPVFKATERGRVRLDGDRVIVLGENPLFAEVFFCRTYEGLTLLLDRGAALNEYYDGKVRHGEFYVLKEDPKKDYTEWWRELLSTHPKFKAWINWKDE